MSPGKESSYSNVLLRSAAINIYEELCSLGVLGLSDIHHLSKPDDSVLEKFKSQLTQDEKGCHETNLILKEGQSKLKKNQSWGPWQTEKSGEKPSARAREVQSRG